MRPLDVNCLAWLRAVAAAAALCLLAACGGGDDEPATPAPTPPAPAATLPFKVMPARASLAENAEARLAVFGTGSAVAWSSSDPAIVEVGASGAIKAVARGSATITATDGVNSSSAKVSVWRTEGADPDESSDALIAAALAAGGITAEDALVYRVYAMFGDERLPAAYEGPPAPDGGLSLRHVSGQLPALSPATQEILRPFLTPPIYAGSWFGRQLGIAPPAASRKRGAQLGTTVVCSAELVDAYMQVGLLLRRTTAHYNLYTWVSPFSVQNDTALLDSAAAEVETIDTALTGLLGRHAKSDAAVPCNGGDGAIDIYLVDPGGSMDWGATTTYPGACENTPAYVMLNRYKLGGILAVDPVRGRRWLRTVLAHELTHTIQFGMDRSAACADYDWIDDATAQWTPDHVFPADNEEDGFDKLNHQRTGQYYRDYLQGGHRDALEKANGYTSYIFFQFVARKYKAIAIKALFDAWTGTDSVGSLDVALKAAGSSVKEAWPEFGKALWNDVRENVLTDLRDFDGYDYGMANVVQPDRLAMPGGRATVPILRANNGQLAPRSLAYERIVFPDEASPMLLSNPLGSLPQAEHLKLTAVKKIGGQWRAPEDWTEDATRYLCRDKAAERIEELLLIVSNSDPDRNAAPALVSSADPFELSVSNVGCWKWQGSATLQSLADDGNQRGDNTARAVDLVFEPPIDYAGGSMLLSVTGGSAGGLFTLDSTLPSCRSTITGPVQTVTDDRTTAVLWFNPDLKQPIVPVPDRRVLLLSGTTAIDSTLVQTCNGKTTVTPAPSTHWPWLLFPLVTHPLEVSADGKSIEANVTIAAPPVARTIHTFKFTAMRE